MIWTKTYRLLASFQCKIQHQRENASQHLFLQEICSQVITSKAQEHRSLGRLPPPTILFKETIVKFNGFEETIVNFQWFLRRPSPLNVFWRSDHCHQWFFDGFFIFLPSLSMVFDGSGPLVKQFDGFD